MVDLGKLWPLSLNCWPKVKSETTSQIGHFIAHLLHCWRLLLSVIVWAPERLNWSPALLTGRRENFAMMTSFDYENINLGSPNLHLKEFLYGPTYSPDFVFLALTGAEITGGRFCPPPPPPGRVILRPSSESMLNSKAKSLQFNGQYNYNLHTVRLILEKGNAAAEHCWYQIFYFILE